MAFTAGDLCCAQNMCVQLDDNPLSTGETWSTLPHVTAMAWTQQANTPKIVTSSSAGNEISVCGTVSNTGTLSMACHNSINQPGDFAINAKYHIRWALDCSEPDDNLIDYYEAYIRIITVPQNWDIAGGGAVIVAFGFEVIEWVNMPSMATSEL